MHQNELLQECLSAHRDLLRIEHSLHAWMDYMCHADPAEKWQRPVSHGYAM